MVDKGTLEKKKSELCNQEFIWTKLRIKFFWALIRMLFFFQSVRQATQISKHGLCR